MANISVISAILPCVLAGKFRSDVVFGDSLQVALMSNSQEHAVSVRLGLVYGLTGLGRTPNQRSHH